MLSSTIDKYKKIINLNSNSSCPTFTPKATKRQETITLYRERVFKQKRFQFMLENVTVGYFLIAWVWLYQALGPAY